MNVVAEELYPLATLEGLETSERPLLAEVLLVVEVVEAQLVVPVLEDSWVEDKFAEMEVELQGLSDLGLWEDALEVDS